LTGGVLSLSQLLLDAGCARDWTKVSGDPVKFGLGFFSMFFDIVFILQHFVWYREGRSKSAAGPATPADGAGAPISPSDGAAAELEQERAHNLPRSRSSGSERP
jgi:cystinosin